jgi:hypothetical protein
MMDKKQEFSPSGQPIYRYEPAPPSKIEESLPNPAQREIEEHIAVHFGGVRRVFHEILPVRIHVDIHLVEPREGAEFFTAVTSGLSTLPMAAPPQYPQFRYSELFLCLPKDWKMEEEDFKQESNYWPFRCLKFLARFPHEYKTWIWLMHTIPNGNPVRPFSDDTKLCCSLIAPPKRVPERAYRLRINKDKTIHFHSVIPIYKEEMEFKLKYGAEALLERFEKNGVDELLDIRRPSAVKKGLFGFS